MSYILEALEKAEKKRRAGTVPDLQTMHETTGTGRRAGRRWWPALVAGLLVAQTLVLLLWLRPWQADNDAEGQRPATATEETTASKPATPRLAEVPPAALPTAPDTARIKRASTAGPPAMNQPAVADKTVLPPDNAKPMPTAASQNPNAAAPAATESAQPQPASQEAAAAEEGLVTEAAPSSPDLLIEEPRRDLPAAEQPDPENNSQPRNRSATADKNAVEAIPALSQLPASTRNSLPELTVSYHAYTNNPASRLVSINGHVVRQGQAITKDLVLEEITPSGVIIRNNEQRFRIEVY